MPLETPVSALVAELSRAGARPSERLVRQIVSLGPAASSALLRLATDQAAMREDYPEAYGPIHALRLLGELGDLSVVEHLLAILPISIATDEEGNPAEYVPQLWATEVLQIIGRLPEVQPLLWALADDAERPETMRVAALEALPFAAAFTETRAEVLDQLRARLDDEGASKLMLTTVVSAIAELGDKPSYDKVMALYRARRLDQERMPAAVVRQLLLGGGRPDLSCVKHPLWERYDDHGPRPVDED